jgi:Viral BACON domain
MRSALFVVALLGIACSGSSDRAADTGASPSPVPSPGPAPSPAPGCSATVTGIPTSVGAAFGRYQFTISLPANCEWTARTDAGWADISPSSGTGSATPLLNVNEHERLDTRTLTTTVNGQAFRTIQNPVGCSFTVDPTSFEEGPDHTEVAVTVSTPSHCPWTATSSEGWVRVLTPSGTGSGKVMVELAPNNSDIRNAYLVVAGVRVDVRQRRRG